jgi:hypothetical protein
MSASENQFSLTRVAPREERRGQKAIPASDSGRVVFNAPGAPALDASIRRPRECSAGRAGLERVLIHAKTTLREFQKEPRAKQIHSILAKSL